MPQATTRVVVSQEQDTGVVVVRPATLSVVDRKTISKEQQERVLARLEEFVALLKKKAIAAGEDGRLSQEQIGEQVGYAQQTISKILRVGPDAVTVEFAYHLAYRLGSTFGAMVERGEVPPALAEPVVDRKAKKDTAAIRRAVRIGSSRASQSETQSDTSRKR